jgi:hypothetical protein
MSALPQKTYMVQHARDVRFVPQADKDDAGAALPPTASLPSSFGVPNFAVMPFKDSMVSDPRVCLSGRRRV